MLKKVTMIERVKTPCIGVCSTGIGDQVCRGCKRFEHEVVSWNAFSGKEKRLVINRLDSLIKKILYDKIEIIDAKKIEQTLQVQNIRYDKNASVEYWLFVLLTRASSQMEETKRFGFKVIRPWHKMPLSELKDVIDADFFTLSCVHFERYFNQV